MQASGKKSHEASKAVATARRIFFGVAAALFVCAQGSAVRAESSFGSWRARLWVEAQARGIEQSTFDRAMDVQVDLSLPDLVIPGRPVKEQAEFVKLPSDYLPAGQLSSLARQGQQLLLKNRLLLDRIEAEFGVPGNVVIAIWGRETDYGAERQHHQVVRSLVTLAYLGRRRDLFKNELLTALELIQQGKISMDAMGSWSGAMGLTQFEPTDFVKFAVDGDGDGKIDLTGSIPDALASAAKQLRDYGWQRGKPWGFEVRVPAQLSCLEGGPDVERPLSAWLRMGVMPTSKASLSADSLQDPARLVLPAGVYGPAFLAFANFQVFRRYNQSDNYALFVGQLSDLIAGGPAFEKAWARLLPLRSNEIEEIQSLLRKGGFYYDAVDARLGSATRHAIGLFQQAAGLNVDCWPLPTLLDDLRHFQPHNGVADTTSAPQNPSSGAAERSIASPLPAVNRPSLGTAIAR